VKLTIGVTGNIGSGKSLVAEILRDKGCALVDADRAAHALYESLCDRANPLGLLPEQIDPTSGRFLGNFPQAFSHIGVIASGFNLARQQERLER
jgi:GH15 family glucan-1,4-alpha-glucosidase